MHKILSTLLISLGAGLSTFWAIFTWQKNDIDRHHDHQSSFEWFCEEFEVTAAQCEEIQKLHLEYFPECETHCIHFADTLQTLAEITSDATLDSHLEHVQAAAELVQLQKEADKKFIDFIYKIAAEMDPASGERYLLRMKGWLAKSPQFAGE